jgi:hypothetical protein
MNFNPNLFLFTSAIALCALHTTDAQEVRFSSGIQYGTFAMKGLSEYQSHLADPEFLNAKETERFSPSIGYQGSFVYIGRKRLRGGVEFAHFRTEGKVVGENAQVIYFHHRAMTSTLGGTFSFLLNKKEQPWEILLSVSTGGSFNKFRRRFPDLEKGPQTHRYYSRSMYAAGGPTVTRKFKHWFANASVQYLHDFGGRLKRTELTDMTLRNAEGDELSLDWSGLRLSIGVGARLAY